MTLNNYKILELNNSNKNGYVYSKDIMEKVIDNWKEKGKKLGEFKTNNNSLSKTNLLHISHKVNDLKIEGNDVIGDIEIYDTPYGTLCQELVNNGHELKFVPKMIMESKELMDENGNKVKEFIPQELISIDIYGDKLDI